MTALRTTQRRQTSIMLAVTTAAVVLVAVLGLAGVGALRRYEGATKVEVDYVDLAPTQVGMLATVDEIDRLTTVTVFVLTPAAGGQVGGSIISVPVAADTTFGAGDDRVSLEEAYAAEGATEFGSIVESVLSITLDQWEVMNAPAAAALLAPLGSVEVDFPAPVVTTDGEENVVLHEAGEATLSVGALVDVFDAQVTGTPESTRRPNVEAVWAGIAEAVGPGIGSVAPEAPIDSLGALVQRLLAGPVAARGLAANPIDAADNQAGDDVVALDRGDVVMVFASVAPNSMSAPAPGLVYRIEAPSGYDDRVRFAISAVLYFGGNVQSVYISDSVPVEPATVFEIYDPRFEERTEDSAALFGMVKFVEPTVKISGVDAVIRLGSEFLDGSSVGLPVVTSTTFSTGVDG